MSQRTVISLPGYLRQQVDECLERGEATTMNQLIQFALHDYLRRKKLERWDNENFSELESGLLKKHPSSGVLISRRFQKDLNKIREDGEKDGVWQLVQLVFRKLAGFDVPLRKYDFRVYELGLEGYYLAKFDGLELIFRQDQQREDRQREDRQHQQNQKKIIACRLGCRIMQDSE